jgi:hypothetical protein
MHLYALHKPKIKKRPPRQKLKQKTEEREDRGGWGLDLK